MLRINDILPIFCDAQINEKEDSLPTWSNPIDYFILLGRLTNSPEQFGHTSFILSVQSGQKVHS